MTDPTAETADFDGCNRKCRRAGAHTLVYGECEHAPEPEPTVSLSRVYRAADGFPAIGFETYTVPELARLIESAVGDPLRAAVAARAIVHRNDDTEPAAQPPVDRAAILREAAVFAEGPQLGIHPELDAVRLEIADGLRRLAGETPATTDRAELERLAAADTEELTDLPVEVRRLVHAVDSMRDHWAEADDARRAELWRTVHAANDAVWGRRDEAAAGARQDGALTPCTCRQTVHAREHKTPVDGCPWCMPAPDIRPKRPGTETVPTGDAL